MKTTARTSTIPSLRVKKELHAAVEAALTEGETLSSFLLESIQFNIQRRAMQQAFVAVGLSARDEGCSTEKYISPDKVLAGLDKSLVKARKKVARN